MKKLIAIGLLAGSLSFAQGMPSAIPAIPAAPAAAPVLGQAQAAGIDTAQKAKTVATAPGATGTDVVNAGKVAGADVVKTGATLGTGALEQGKTQGKAKLNELADKAEAKGGELADQATVKVAAVPGAPIANSVAKQGLKKGVGAAKSKAGIAPPPTQPR